ncbi:MAG TPA: STAS domain-containing protein [Solirubrobacteraceae bacterium]|jgi:anti-sigma B factor antagonist|nr:STAS domain-containing protein [Solirubrobacteraceae bacterium]
MSFFYIGDDMTFEHSEHADDAVLLVAGGEIDFAASPRLRERIADAIDAGRRRLVLDLSKATFIDSTAVGVLVGAVLRLHEHGGGSLGVICAEENVRVLRIFEIAGVESVIALYRSREEGLSALATVGDARVGRASGHGPR